MTVVVAGSAFVASEWGMTAASLNEGGEVTLSVEGKVEVLNITICAKDFAKVCLVDVARELFHHDLEMDQYISTCWYLWASLLSSFWAQATCSDFLYSSSLEASLLALGSYFSIGWDFYLCHCTRYGHPAYRIAIHYESAILSLSGVRWIVAVVGSASSMALALSHSVNLALASESAHALVRVKTCSQDWDSGWTGQSMPRMYLSKVSDLIFNCA